MFFMELLLLNLMEKFESEINADRESSASYTRFESSPSVG